MHEPFSDFAGLDLALKILFPLPQIVVQNDPGASKFAEQRKRPPTLQQYLGGGGDVHAYYSLILLQYDLFLEFVDKTVKKRVVLNISNFKFAKRLTLFHTAKFFYKNPTRAQYRL